MRYFLHYLVPLPPAGADILSAPLWYRATFPFWYKWTSIFFQTVGYTVRTEGLRMKKLLGMLLVLLAIPVGLFFYKGGHHALALAPKLADWAAQEQGELECALTVGEWALEEQVFWQPQGEARLYGLAERGVYVREGVLFLDNGRAYTLPKLQGTDDLRRLAWGILAYGRVTKEGEVYRLQAEADGWAVHAAFVATDRALSIECDLKLPQFTGKLSVSQLPDQEHPVPEAVLDAIVLAQMEPPVSLEEPLNAIFPALKQLSVIRANVRLGVECGLLNLSEAAELTVENGTAVLTREGVEYRLALPQDWQELSPIAAGLAVLKHGEFRQEGERALFRLALPPEEAAALCQELVPPLAELGLTFDTAYAELCVTAGRLDTVTLTAGGQVPFLITQIPITFTGEFQIKTP